VPPAAVFRALTDPAALRAWLAEDADIGLDDGASHSGAAACLRACAGGTGSSPRNRIGSSRSHGRSTASRRPSGSSVDGEITKFEPGEVLVYGDSEGAVVRWELAATAGGTHLTFMQSGFGPDELDSAAQHEAGWLGGLADLRRMHELGAGWTPVSTDLPE
jgi:uncharacterized protein YndB with AHSA1/START domain